MYLIDVCTRRISEFTGDKIPPYAILSHTWGEEEVSFQETLAGSGQAKAGYQKILQCCQQAQLDGFNYVWIDTCCIDKKSSAELSEAINSMYEWYARSEICYVYLADTTRSLFEENGTCSRWFTRGWTLQELLAPRHVEFYDRNWVRVGTKISLVSHIDTITGIRRSALCGANPRNFSVAERFSWAAGRRTTRPEDRTYSLLGLFGIQMPLLYGEGEMAFQRLQKKIMKSTEDRTVLAWGGNKLKSANGDLQLVGLLANSPDDFEGSHDVYLNTEWSTTYAWPPAITESDVILNLPAIELPHSDKATIKVVDLGCKCSPNASVYLRLLGGRFRVGPLLMMEDRFRDEYSFIPEPIRALRHSLSNSRHPLAFFFAGIQRHKSSTDAEIKAVLQYVGVTDENEDSSRHSHANILTYSNLEAFNAANLAELSMSQSHVLSCEDQQLLRPNLDWKSDPNPEDTPEGRTTYTICMIVLKRQRKDLCRIAIGAQHFPVNRPWCIIDQADSNVTDDEWFKGKVRDWDGGIDTPDQCALNITLSKRKHLEVTVMLRKRCPDLQVVEEAQCYGVVIHAVEVEVEGPTISRYRTKRAQKHATTKRKVNKRVRI